VKAIKLFILWAALNRAAVNLGAFIGSHLAEHAKPSSRVVIAAGGIITALGRAFGFGGQIDRLAVLHTPGRIDLATFLNMKLFQTIGVGQLWLSHHGRALFPLPNPAKTTITHLFNLLYDDAVDSEVGGVKGGGHDDDRYNDDDDAEDVPRVHSARRHAPAGPSGVPPRTTDASSSRAMDPSMFQTVLDRLNQLQV